MPPPTREKREPAVHGDIGVALAIPQFTKATESQIIEHIGYTVSYNQKRRNPNWVAYELTADEVEGEVPRGKDFIPVTPGVRFADGDKVDQKRVMTPAQAKEIGSDYIVVGRPITAAPDPVAAYRRCVAEFVG